VPAKKVEASAEITVEKLTTVTLVFYILGITPILLNRMSIKAWQSLLLPPPKSRGNKKESILKHDPKNEFRASSYLLPGGPTLIGHLASAFKGAMAGAALDLPGTNKSEIGRLCWVDGEYIPIWGIPELHMSVVRMADAKKTPDIRTRVIMREWACKISVTFVSPNLSAKTVANILSAAGFVLDVKETHFRTRFSLVKDAR